jgi:hypothetical protein
MTADALRDRLTALRRERDDGEAQLELLALRRRDLEATVLRIDGAIAVLEELLAAGDAVGAASDGAAG